MSGLAIMARIVAPGTVLPRTDQARDPEAASSIESPQGKSSRDTLSRPRLRPWSAWTSQACSVLPSPPWKVPAAVGFVVMDFILFILFGLSLFHVPTWEAELAGAGTRLFLGSANDFLNFFEVALISKKPAVWGPLQRHFARWPAPSRDS